MCAVGRFQQGQSGLSSLPGLYKISLQPDVMSQPFVVLEREVAQICGFFAKPDFTNQMFGLRVQFSLVECLLSMQEALGSMFSISQVWWYSM